MTIKPIHYNRWKTKLRLICERMAHSRYGVSMMCLFTYLGGFIFPVPSDAMLPPMIVGRPEKWKWLMASCVLFSVAGAYSAYTLGAYFSTELFTWSHSNKLGDLSQATALMAEYGSPILFIAAFAPIPFKTLAVAAGAGDMSLSLFLPAVALGRTVRFYVISRVTLQSLKWLSPHLH
jgi:membrane protein YqaA with SNARE-associated domain